MARVDGRQSAMKLFGSYIRHYPRTVAALVFGSATLVAQYFAWTPEARMSSLALALTVGVGLSHAIAGALTGPLLVDGVRVRTSSQAGLLGAGTSLIALIVFTSAFTAYMFATDVHPESAGSYFAFILLTAVFAFLGDAWALFLVSIGLGWALYRVAACAEMPDVP